MATARVPMDLDAYERRSRGGDCFICDLVGARLRAALAAQQG